MMRRWVWGTDVEMMAAATLFRAPVYYLKKSTSEEGYHWDVFQPLTLPTNTQLRLPESSEEDPLYSTSPHPQSTLSCSTTTCIMIALYPEEPENPAILHQRYYRDITLYNSQTLTHLNLSLVLVMPKRKTEKNCMYAILNRMIVETIVHVTLTLPSNVA